MIKRSWMMAVAFLTFSGAAFAELVLTPPTGNSLSNGAGSTRGDIITMTGDFDLTSIGIDALIANGAQLTFNAYVYDDQGGSGVNPLAVGTSETVTGNGTEQFFDLPVSYTLQNGQSYDIGIDFHSFNDPNLDINYFFFDSGSNSPFSVGPVMVLDGEDGHCGSCNVYSPNLRLNGNGTTFSGPVVPEPDTLPSLAVGILVLAGVIQYRKSAKRRA